jgi:hypothetical protein
MSMEVFKMLAQFVLAAVLIGQSADPTPIPLTASPDKPARGRMVKVRAKTEAKAKAPLWRVEGPAVDVEPDGPLLRFVTSGPGVVTVRVYAPAGDGVAEGVIAITVDGPPEPAPPPRPDPNDPLLADLKAAYLAESSATKAADLVQLAAVYREAVEFSKSADAAKVSDLVAKVRAIAARLVPPAALTGVRQRIATELSKTFPHDGPLTAESREAAAAAFARIAGALEALK